LSRAGGGLTFSADRSWRSSSTLTEYVELHGVEISGTAEVVGEIPRMCSPDDELARPELLFARKYFGADTFFPDGKHAWLRVTPEKLTSWDFRKLYPPSAND